MTKFEKDLYASLVEARYGVQSLDQLAVEYPAVPPEVLQDAKGTKEPLRILVSRALGIKYIERDWRGRKAGSGTLGQI